MQGMKLIRIDCMLEREAAAEDRAHRHCDCHRDEATLTASEVAWPAFSVDEAKLFTTKRYPFIATSTRTVVRICSLPCLEENQRGVRT